MEGLLPMVYKSLKKTKTRRRYEVLSSGTAQTYKVEDFYAKDDQYITKYYEGQRDRVPPEASHHRRYNSVQIDHTTSFPKRDDDGYKKPDKQLVRFRSHRLFSCVTGE